MVPASILGAACILIPQIADMSTGRQEFFQVTPYLIAALGIFLSVHFHRGRPFMVLLLLVVFYWSSRHYLVGRPYTVGVERITQRYRLGIYFVEA